MLIRKANSTDAKSTFDIRIAAINSQCIGHYAQRDLEIWTTGAMSKNFVTIVEEIGYVATLNDVVVGTGMLDLKSGQVDMIFVQPSHMGCGIGRTMMFYLENLAIAAGLAQMKLDATLNAASFYRACGFEGDTVAKYESPRGISLDCIPMIKGLHTSGHAI